MDQSDIQRWIQLRQQKCQQHNNCLLAFTILRTCCDCEYLSSDDSQKDHWFDFRRTNWCCCDCSEFNCQLRCRWVLKLIECVFYAKRRSCQWNLSHGSRDKRSCRHVEKSCRDGNLTNHKLQICLSDSHFLHLAYFGGDAQKSRHVPKEGRRV